MTGSVLRAGALEVTVEDHTVQVAFGTPDWFGPGRLLVTTGPDAASLSGAVDATAREDDGMIVFRLHTDTDVHGFATGTFARPSIAWPAFTPAARAAGGIPDGSRAFGFQYTEFAWPTQSDASLSRWRLLPFRPSVVGPMGVVAPDGRCLLLAPLDSFHEQIISVEDGIACGWHGDLDEAAAGFATEIALIPGTGPRDCLDRYGALLQRRSGTRRPSVDRDELGRRVSYWTDNGSAYWYRTEPGHDTTSTLQATLADLRARDIPFGAVQLDSWWYPHEVVRPFDTEEWVVPPTGLVQWDAREDVIPDGVRALRSALDDPPLVAHCRHLSSSSPYVDAFDCWIDGDRAHPRNDDLYERWLDQALAWGVETFEHDWLVESFLGVRGLRAAPGRAARWQEGLDRAATARGMTLQWCMPTPADFLQSTTLEALTSIRTSGDHGYLIGPGELWTWFLLTNAFARALGLRPYKDVFFSDATEQGHHSDVEAMLAALSTGPVGIGDRRGRADRDVVLRTCREDGVIVRPDVTIAAVDRAFVEHPVGRSVPLVGETWTDHEAGRWTYVATMNVSRSEAAFDEAVTLSSLGAAVPDVPVVRWDWRAGRATVLGADRAYRVQLDVLDWDLSVLAPVLPCGLALIGDTTRYATAGRARLGTIRADASGLACSVLGPGEWVTITGWSDRPPTRARVWAASSWIETDVEWSDHVWTVDVNVPARGWTHLEVTA